MIAHAPLIVYCVGCLLAWRPIFRWYVHSETGGPVHNWEDFLWTFWIASIAACLWPVVVFVRTIIYVASHIDPQHAARVLGGESRRERAERRERELDQLERDNHRRARELGIES